MRRLHMVPAKGSSQFDKQCVLLLVDRPKLFAQEPECDECAVFTPC